MANLGQCWVMNHKRWLHLYREHIIGNWYVDYINVDQSELLYWVIRVCNTTILNTDDCHMSHMDMGVPKKLWVPQTMASILKSVLCWMIPGYPRLGKSLYSGDSND